MNRTLTRTPLNAELKERIYAAFARHDRQSAGAERMVGEPVAFEAREDGHWVGCVVVRLFWGQLHIKYLLVDETQRGKGWGHALMEQALAFGASEGCRFAFVETLGHQAPGFYTRLGFEVELQRDGYAGGNCFYYLKKAL
ncbi:GNAT family N-acetyltransferase [Paludibacterium paludis]|uniref:N-acetyltransferase domain-containing protein n=1 Tax=Paludibacterium paludis TaxID=1225769 RepID=A0A918P5E3_9NEIS|nr:GNAT family N-acetyltransferase [Paludibacterium paludis]GGY21691.1 hypothetical protein GCM10011289_26710 [Paludibacterium paludis]